MIPQFCVVSVRQHNSIGTAFSHVIYKAQAQAINTKLRDLSDLLYLIIISYITMALPNQLRKYLYVTYTYIFGACQNS
jgi:hypothetical protein